MVALFTTILDVIGILFFIAAMGFLLAAVSLPAAFGAAGATAIGFSALLTWRASRAHRGQPTGGDSE